jgi:hypothetical protein
MTDKQKKFLKRFNRIEIYLFAFIMYSIPFIFGPILAMLHGLCSHYVARICLLISCIIYGVTLIYYFYGLIKSIGISRLHIEEMVGGSINWA